MFVSRRKTAISHFKLLQLQKLFSVSWMFASLEMAREGSMLTKIGLVLVYLGPHFF